MDRTNGAAKAAWQCSLLIGAFVNRGHFGYHVHLFGAAGFAP
jgi:hypothetical protein